MGQTCFMENQIEIWKPVVGWEEMYLVSNFGRIYSLDRRVGGPSLEGRVVKGRLRKFLNVRGYFSVNLIDSKTKKSTRNGVHVFVAQSFIPNPYNKPCVNHIDGNKQNNHVSNLEWVTYKENAQHAYKIGLKKPTIITDAHKQILRTRAKERQSLRKWITNNKDKAKENALRASLLQVKKVNQFDKCGTFIKQWSSMAEAARAIGVSGASITRCAKGAQKFAGGFKWKYEI